MNKLTKLFIAIGVLIAGGGLGVYYFADMHRSVQIEEVQTESEVVTEYDDLLSQVMAMKNESEFDLATRESSTAESNVSIEKALRVGIRTNAGIIKVVDKSTQTLPQFVIKVNDTDTQINSVVPINLVRALALDGNQVLLFNVSQGDNNCDVQYQFLTIHDNKYNTTKPFGTCLPITNITDSESKLTITMPQSNPYLGDDVSYTYVYQSGKVKLQSKPSKKQIKQAFSSYTAKIIVDTAKKDGCYQDGVMLDNVSCGGGKRYCSMFRNLKATAKKDSNYMILKDFCS